MSEPTSTISSERRRRTSSRTSRRLGVSWSLLHATGAVTVTSVGSAPISLSMAAGTLPSRPPLKPLTTPPASARADGRAGASIGPEPTISTPLALSFPPAWTSSVATAASVRRSHSWASPGGSRTGSTTRHGRSNGQWPWRHSRAIRHQSSSGTAARSTDSGKRSSKRVCSYSSEAGSTVQENVARPPPTTGCASSIRRMSCLLAPESPPVRAEDRQGALPKPPPAAGLDPLQRLVPRLEVRELHVPSLELRSLCGQPPTGGEQPVEAPVHPLHEGPVGPLRHQQLHQHPR